jgi:enoyl-CoA hydratase/carnithine racemase
MPEGAAESPIHYEKRGHVAHVTLNRPERLNAMNRRMHADLLAVWEDIEADDECWVAVVKGAGDRAFSVGQDLKELAERERDGGPERSTFGSAGKPGWPRITDRFDLTKPIIAQVRGYALGGGFELALACDLIVAAEDAVFGLPEAKLGLVAGAGGVFRLPRQIPQRVAMGHLLTGRELGAERAFALGLVNEVVPVAGLQAATNAWVEDILACAPLAVRAVRQAVRQSLDLPLPEAFHATYEVEERRRTSRDALEGPRAFTEKRTPRWEGR